MVHEKQKDYPCPECEQSFGDKANLARHIITVHENQRNHTCPICLVSFGHKGYIRQHIKTVHENKKDHTCSICEKSFGAKSDLKTDVSRVHENRKNHICSVCCSETFGYRAALLRHKKLKHSEKSVQLDLPSVRDENCVTEIK